MAFPGPRCLSSILTLSSPRLVAVGTLGAAGCVGPGRSRTSAKARRAWAMARRADGNDQALVELKAVDDVYPLYGSVELQSGQSLGQALEFNNGAWGAVAELALLARLDVEVGDTISLGRANIVIRDVVETEPDKLAGGMDFGPRLMISKDAAPDTDLIQPGSLVRSDGCLQGGGVPRFGAFAQGFGQGRDRVS